MYTKTRIAAIIIQDGKILMLRWKGYDELRTPWGKIEEWESDETCLRRELHEEIGVELIELNFFKEYSSPAFYTPNKITKQKIYLTTISGQITPNAEIENFVRLNREDFENKKYPMIPIDRESLIPDLIEERLF